MRTCDLYVWDTQGGDTPPAPKAQTGQLRFAPVSLAQFLLNIFSCQSLTASREKASGQTMSAGDIFKVETVFISDPVEGGAGNVLQPKITNQVSPHGCSCTSLEELSLQCMTKGI